MFLDTARLGQMSPGAQRAHADLARMAGVEGASPYFERFLVSGFDNPADAARYPGLACWRGVPHLKSCLRELTGSPVGLPILLAARSVNLMRLAARLLFLRCRNVLAADLGWPGYHTLLTAESMRTGRTVTVVRLLNDILASRSDYASVIERVGSVYRAGGCDGLFLPAVSSHGVRLPVEDITRTLGRVRELRFVVVDGAQGYCHTPADLGTEYCDLYLAGCHKWLGGYHPLGLAFYGRRRSASLIEAVLADHLRVGYLDDPLLRFTAGLEAGAVAEVDETVSLVALFTAQAAAADAATTGRLNQEVFDIRLANAARVAEAAAASGWNPLVPAGAFRSGIVLAQPGTPCASERTGQDTRARFAAEGIVLTAYGGGLIRMSMPGRPCSVDQLGHLSRVFRQLVTSNQQFVPYCRDYRPHIW